MAKQNNVERLIQLLRDGQWHPGDELAFHVSWRFGHTVHVARKRGYQIEKRKIAQNQFEYRLLTA